MPSISGSSTASLTSSSDSARSLGGGGLEAKVPMKKKAPPVTPENEFYFNATVMQVMADTLLTKTAPSSALMAAAIVRGRVIDDNRLYVHQAQIKQYQQRTARSREEALARQQAVVKDLKEKSESKELGGKFKLWLKMNEEQAKLDALEASRPLAYESFPEKKDKQEQAKALTLRSQQSAEFAMQFLISRAFMCARKSLNVTDKPSSDKVNARLQQRALIFIPRLVERLIDFAVNQGMNERQRLIKKATEISSKLILLQRVVPGDDQGRTQLEIAIQDAELATQEPLARYQEARGDALLETFRQKELDKRKSAFDAAFQKRSAEIARLESKDRSLMGEQKQKYVLREARIKTELPALKEKRKQLSAELLNNTRDRLAQEEKVKSAHASLLDTYHSGEAKDENQLIYKHLQAFNADRKDVHAKRIEEKEAEIETLNLSSQFAREQLAQAPRYRSAIKRHKTNVASQNLEIDGHNKLLDEAREILEADEFKVSLEDRARLLFGLVSARVVLRESGYRLSLEKQEHALCNLKRAHKDLEAKHLSDLVSAGDNQLLRQEAKKINAAEKAESQAVISRAEAAINTLHEDFTEAVKEALSICQDLRAKKVEFLEAKKAKVIAEIQRYEGYLEQDQPVYEERIKVNKQQVVRLKKEVQEMQAQTQRSISADELTVEDIDWIYNAELQAQLDIVRVQFKEKRDAIEARKAEVVALVKELSRPMDELGLDKSTFLTEKESKRLKELQEEAENERGRKAPELTAEDEQKLAADCAADESKKLKAYAVAMGGLRELKEKIPGLEAEQARLSDELLKLPNFVVMSEDVLLHLAFACTVFKGQEEVKPLPLHKLIQKNALSGHYVSDSTQHWYEAYAAGAWMFACLLVENLCEFVLKANFDDFPLSLYNSPDINMALCCIIIKCLWGLLTAAAIAYVGRSRYEGIQIVKLKELAGEEGLEQELAPKVEGSAKHFSEGLFYGMMAFQLASTAVQVAFLFLPPAQLAYLCYMAVSALAVGISTGLALAHRYAKQFEADERQSWNAVGGQYYPGAPQDPNNITDQDAEVVHREGYFREHLAKRKTETGYRLKMMRCVVVGLLSGFAWQCVSLLPFGVGPALAEGVRKFVIPVLSLLASILITLIVKKIFDGCLSDKSKEDSIVNGLLPVKNRENAQGEKEVVAPCKMETVSWLEGEYAPSRGMAI